MRLFADSKIGAETEPLLCLDNDKMFQGAIIRICDTETESNLPSLLKISTHLLSAKLTHI